jgi:oligoendopeptidase F
MKKTIPARAEVAVSDRWNLERLFGSDAAWEAALKELEHLQPSIDAFRQGFPGTPDRFLELLGFQAAYLLLEERLEYYAHLRMSEDEGESVSRGRHARFVGIATRGQAAWAWLAPAIQGLPEAFVDGCLADSRFADYSIHLRKLLRYKPHILSEAEERLLALQSEANRVAQETFAVLTNVDMEFGSIETPEGSMPLSQSAFASLIRNRDRSVREKTYRQFYGAYDAHKTTIASLYAGSVKLDKYQAQARNFSGSRVQALFPDNVPESVYDNLVGTVDANLPVLHRYYSLRKKALGLDGLRHWDVYVPFVPNAPVKKHSYEEAVDIVTEALAPLGPEYVGTLRKGLLGGWVDRYENKGKRSGAFSAGSFAGDPYILLNYKDDVQSDIFTMAHEGGHSMHSWYSSRNNPFMCYSYTIFEAEVASTFNEQLVFDYLYRRAADDRERASLLANRIDDTLGTLFRQTMFAEYETITHRMAESGEALTVDSLRNAYRSLLEKYFGPEMQLEPVSDLECLRIPHFYNAFYVYKYATGVSASIALSKRVLTGGEKERMDYFNFLKSGGSRFPIEALKVAGVDMSKPEPVELACARFAEDVGRLEALLYPAG